VCAVSIECERVFSDAGNINSERRSRLSPEHLDILTMLKHNLKNKKLMQYVTTMMAGLTDDVLSDSEDDEDALWNDRLE